MSQRQRVPTLVRDNGLLFACLGFFVVFFAGMIVSGAATYNQEQQEHGSHEQISVLKYLSTGDFVEATFENWESEFLQMGLFVLLTGFLYQRGSSESKRIEEPEAVDEDPTEAKQDAETPWPVRQGGLWLRDLQVFAGRASSFRSPWSYSCQCGCDNRARRNRSPSRHRRAIRVSRAASSSAALSLPCYVATNPARQPCCFWRLIWNSNHCTRSMSTSLRTSTVPKARF